MITIGIPEAIASLMIACVAGFVLAAAISDAGKDKNGPGNDATG